MLALTVIGIYASVESGSQVASSVLSWEAAMSLQEADILLWLHSKPLNIYKILFVTKRIITKLLLGNNRAHFGYSVECVLLVKPAGDR